MAFKMKSPFKSVNAQGWSNQMIAQGTGLEINVLDGAPVNTPVGIPNQPMPQQPADMGKFATAYNTGQMQQDLITITCTADTELKVMKSIAAAINAAKRNNSEGYVVIADDVNSTYVDSAITGIDYTIDS